ncbi:hypothetical protein G6011_06991 [Alternaria panax]|uniref:BTB domain-containing protein n=1 Tax=Alternaria panax TaxID=48097 RepID=A0AAD4FA40_9PLEO|nr:hypothetical protein G6011_06991 [Alternaria panax]
MAITYESAVENSTTTTPPVTPSRASTLATPSVGRSSVFMEPPRMDNAADFKAYPHIPNSAGHNPPQMLMQTLITIECGPDLKTKLTVHEEILCCHSNQLQGQFSKAKTARTDYEKAGEFREKLAAYVFPEASQKDYEGGHFDLQVKPLIKSAAEKYPLLGYATHVKKIIMDEVNSQIHAKNIKKAAQKPSQIATDLSLSGRLDLLKPHAVHAVAEKLYLSLHEIKKAEVKKAIKDPFKAAAQHRLILPNTKETTVRVLMQWIYRGQFLYQGYEQLYSVLKLATQLGVDALASSCLRQMYNAANNSLLHASTHGVLLQTLLGYGPDAATDDVVGVVFKHAVKDDDAPKELKSLVVNTLAAMLDPELWQHFKDLVKHSMALQVIEAMIGLRQHVKLETDDQEDRVKPEGEGAAYIQSNFPVDDEQMSCVGDCDEKQV